MPFQFQQYRNPYAGTLTSLIGGSDRVRADQAQQEGAIAANTTKEVGGQIAGTLGMLAQAKMKQDALARDPQHQLYAMKVADEKRAQADDVMMRQALTSANGDPEKALDLLRSRGEIGVTAAGKLQTQVTQKRTEALKELDDKLTRTGKQLSLATQLLQGIPDPTEDDSGQVVPHPDAANAYVSIVPKLREVLGPDLGQRVPDDYNPAVVAQMKSMGESAQDHLARQRDAILLAGKAVTEAKDARERDEYFTKAVGTALSTTESQTEWDQQLALAKGLGAPSATLGKFGTVWTPDAGKTALKLATSPDKLAELSKPPPAVKPPEEGSIANYIATYARDVAKKPVETLSIKEKETAVRRFVALHKTDAPEDMSQAKRTEMVAAIMKFPSVYQDLTDTQKGKLIPDLASAGFTAFGEPSRATVATSERWRVTALQKVDENLGYQIITPDQAQQQRDQIETSYKAQTGKSSTPAAPTAAKTTETTKTTEPKIAGQVPADVTSALKGKPAGKYTGKDGRVFYVLPNGSVSSTPPQ